jgi:peptidoglycan hydrolase-like protein with peptidoglycan-binding domain
MSYRYLWAAFGLFLPQVAFADTALVIGNSRFDEAATIRVADDLLDAADDLEEAGFRVFSGEDQTAAEMRALLSEVLAEGEESRVVIALSGHFAQATLLDGAGGKSWFLGREVDAPDLATVGGQGIALSTILDIASQAQGRAIVLLGTEDRSIELGAGLQPGLGQIDVPQGVTVISGEARDIARFARRDLLEPGVSIGEMVAQSETLTGFGFLPPSLPFLDLPEAEGSAEVIAPPPVETGSDPEEQALWEAVAELNTEAAYTAYLNEYPAGPNAAEALARLDAIRAEPGRAARLAEEALELTRAERQEIQRDLTLLDYNPRGIDGIFGPGSRGAIGAWQAAEGIEASGYLDTGQITRLSDMADARAAELEEEARLRAEAQERADRAYWQASGQGADEAGLRSYLERYPDGVFSDLARDRLDEIEAVARVETEAEERVAWDWAQDQGTEAAYRGYLESYPDGAFAGAANARLDELDDDGRDRDLIAQLEAREAGLNLTPVTRRLIEQRLAGAGLDPGPVDGVFDNDTRRAMRRYQQARNLQVTGYLDQSTVVRLLADAVGVIIRQ